MILVPTRGSILVGRRRSRHPVQVPYSLKLEPYNPSSPSTYSLEGSCLDPRPDLRRLRRAPGRGSFCSLKFEATGLSLDFEGPLGHVLVSEWHFG